MPLRARLTTIAMIWGASSISLWMVGTSGTDCSLVRAITILVARRQSGPDS